MSAGSIYHHFQTTFPSPIEGALRLWWVPQVPGKPFNWPMASVEIASAVLDMLAAYDDFQFAENVKGDYCNAAGLEVYRNGKWEEWESEEGDCIDEWQQTHAVNGY